MQGEQEAGELVTAHLASVFANAEHFGERPKVFKWKRLNPPASGRQIPLLL
jgi:hypothetical protein